MLAEGELHAINILNKNLYITSGYRTHKDNKTCTKGRRDAILNICFFCILLQIMTSKNSFFAGFSYIQNYIREGEEMANNKDMQRGFLDKHFFLQEYGTDVKTEVISGITTFVTMAYIIFVNPTILMQAGMNTKGLLGADAINAGLNVANDPVVGAVFVATIIASVIATLIMGLFANAPFALGPGMGMNAFFTFTVVLTLHYSWQAALAIVFISGIINILITATSLRMMIVNAIPESLKKAIGAGIGLFIALVGFINSGIIVGNPDTLVTMGSFKSAGTLLAVIGLIITAVLMVLNVKGSMLLGIIATTLIGIPMGVTTIPQNFSFFAKPPSLSPTLFKLNFGELVRLTPGSTVGQVFMGLTTVLIAFILSDMFDTIGTFIGVSEKTGVLEENPKIPKSKGMFPTKMERALFADATATSIGALLGTSNTTTFVESSAGISEGGRTGLTSVVVSLLFLISLFFAPIVGLVPTQATAPALIIVGVLMMSPIMSINFDDFSEAFPAFMTIVMMPFSYSIANGLAAGFIFYPLVKLVMGKGKEVSPIMYVFAVLFILRFVL